MLSVLNLMPFKTTESQESFLFPYRADVEDGRTNNGGFDLLKHPEDIERITEARNFPELKSCLISLHKPNGHFVSVGCLNDLSQESDAFVCLGYLEVCFRSAHLLPKKEAYKKLVELFHVDIHQRYPNFNFEPYLNFDLSQIWFRCSGLRGWKMAMYFRAGGSSKSIAQSQAGGLLTSYAQFLTEHFDPKVF